MTESFELQAVIEDIVASPAEVRAEGVSKDDFCRQWPNIRQGLELLGKLYPKSKIIVAILIAIGNAVCRS